MHVRCMSWFSQPQSKLPVRLSTTALGIMTCLVVQSQRNAYGDGAVHIYVAKQICRLFQSVSQNFASQFSLVLLRKDLYHEIPGVSVTSVSRSFCPRGKRACHICAFSRLGQCCRVRSRRRRSNKSTSKWLSQDLSAHLRPRSMHLDCHFTGNCVNPGPVFQNLPSKPSVIHGEYRCVSRLQQCCRLPKLSY